MKTTLYQQKFLVQEIQKANLAMGIRLLRTWLNEKGYEEDECSHRTIFRESGVCTHCGEIA